MRNDVSARWCSRRLSVTRRTIRGLTGTFDFAHSATTSGGGRQNEFFVIVPTSGTGALAGITGTGGMAIDTDGTHRIWFDYELGQ